MSSHIYNMHETILTDMAHTAQALKLFCCDWDLDLIQELGRKCGLEELEKKHGKTHRSSGGQRRQEEHRMWCAKSTGVKEEDVKRTPALPEDDTAPINYSLFERICSHPEKIRAYLDSTGKLADLMATLRKKARSLPRSEIRDPYYEGYQLNILGACAMTLGARVSVTDREAMRMVSSLLTLFVHFAGADCVKYYKNCGLMRDALKQIEAALDPDTGYKSGTPWDFGSISRDENMMRGGAPKV